MRLQKAEYISEMLDSAMGPKQDSGHLVEGGQSPALFTLRFCSTSASTLAVLPNLTVLLCWQSAGRCDWAVCAWRRYILIHGPPGHHDQIMVQTRVDLYELQFECHNKIREAAHVLPQELHVYGAT